MKLWTLLVGMVALSIEAAFAQPASLYSSVPLRVTSDIIVPQTRGFGPVAGVEVSSVPVNIDILEQVATTTMDVELANLTGLPFAGGAVGVVKIDPGDLVFWGAATLPLTLRSTTPFARRCGSSKWGAFCAWLGNELHDRGIQKSFDVVRGDDGRGRRQRPLLAA